MDVIHKALVLLGVALMLSGCNTISRVFAPPPDHLHVISSEDLADIKEYLIKNGTSDPTCKQVEEYLIKTLDEHLLALGDRGDYRPIGLEAECWEKGRTSISAKQGALSGDDQLSSMLKGIRNGLKKQGTLNLFLFTHGGLNNYRNSVRRFIRDISKIESYEPAHYFPIFVVWPSDLVRTYLDSLGNYDQGLWDDIPDGGLQYIKSDYPNLEPGFYSLLTDIAETAIRAPINIYKSTQRWAKQSLNYNRKDDDEICDRLRTNWGDNSFSCVKESPEHPEVTFPRDNLIYAVTTPLRLITVPAIDPVGKRAWESMLARTRFAFTKPCPLIYKIKDDKRQDGVRSPGQIGGGTCDDGYVKTFLAKLDELIKEEGNDKIKITLVGHSMGAIVSSMVVHTFPNLPYENVVFMGAAVSIREFKNSVEAVLKQRIMAKQCANTPSDPAVGGPFNFYNLSLHPEAESRSKEILGFTPAGSLLEWIDDIYESPGVLEDRALGKWLNVISAVHPEAHNGLDKTSCDHTEEAGHGIFDSAVLRSGYVHFKRFFLSCTDPLKHGEFADTSDDGQNCKDIHKHRDEYWKPEFWW